MAQSLTSVSLAQVGLLYDIFGAFVLAWGFLFIGSKDFRNATRMWRGEPELEKLGFAKVDAWFGVLLIALGFLGQLLGSVGPVDVWFSASGFIGPVVAVLFLFLYVFCFMFFRGTLAARTIARSGVKDEDL